MNDFELQHLPEAYRPLSPWTYFGLGILYSLPLVGWIFLIVHAVGSQNLNRRNYARSYFCGSVLGFGLMAERGGGGGRAERSRRRGQRDIRLRICRPQTERHKYRLDSSRYFVFRREIFPKCGVWPPLSTHSAPAV